MDNPNILNYVDSNLQREPQTQEQSGFNLNTFFIVFVVISIILLIWYFSKTYAKKQDLENIISIVKLLEEEVDLLKKSQDEYKKQTLNELNSMNLEPQEQSLTANTIQNIDIATKSFNQLPDNEQNMKLAQYVQNLKDISDRYKVELNKIQSNNTQLQTLIDTYTKNLAEVKTQYVNILNIREKRNVDLNQIVKAFEDANMYLNEQKKAFNDKLNELLQNANISSSSSSSGSDSSPLLQKLISANENAINNLSNLIKVNVTKTEVNNMINDLNVLIQANISSIEELKKNSQNSQATIDNLKTLINNNIQAVQKLQTPSGTDTELQTLVNSNKKEIDLLKSNIGTLVSSTKLADTIKTLETNITTNSNLIQELKLSQVKKTSFDEVITKINSVIENNSKSIQALQNTQSSFDASGYVNKSVLDMAIGNLSKIVKANDDAIKLLQSSTTTTLKAVDLQNLKELILSQNLSVGDKWSPHAGIINLYAAASGGVDAGPTIRFLNSAGNENLVLTSVVDNPSTPDELAYFRVKNGGLRIDKKAVFNGNIEVKGTIDSNTMVLSKGTYITDKNEQAERSGRLIIRAVSESDGGIISFEDSTINRNTWVFMKGHKAGLLVNRHIHTGGSIFVGTMEEMPAQIGFKDSSGVKRTFIQLETGTSTPSLFTPADFNVGGSTSIVGKLNVNGDVVLSNKLTGKVINAEFMDLSNNLNVAGSATITGSLDVKNKLNVGGLGSFVNGLEARGTNTFIGKTTKPSKLQIGQQEGEYSHLTFYDNNDKKLGSLLAQESGLSVNTPNFSINGTLQSKGNLEIGIIGKPDGKNSNLTLYGAEFPNSIDFKGNKCDPKTNICNNQGFIQGNNNGGIKIGGGPLMSEGDLIVYGQADIKKDLLLAGNLNAIGNIKGNEIIASQTLFALSDSIMSGNITIKGNSILEGGLSVSGKTKLSDLELTKSLNVGVLDPVTNDDYPAGQININSNSTTGGSIIFKDRNRNDTSKISYDNNISKLVFQNRDIQFNDNVNFEKNIVVSGQTITKDLRLQNNLQLDEQAKILINNNLVHLTRSYNVDLSEEFKYEKDKFYPVILNRNPFGNNSVPDITFKISNTALPATDQFNDHTFSGIARGGGWTDKRPFVVSHTIKHTTTESKILSLYRGNASFTGIAFYLRGGYKFTITTDADNVIYPKFDSVISSVGSVFAIRDINDKDVVGVSDKIEILQNVATARNGIFISDDIVVSGLIQGNFIEARRALTSRGTLDVTGNSTFTGASKFDGNATFGKDLSVTGASKFDSNTTFGKDLSVTGASKFDGNTTFSKDLSVTGASVFDGNVTFNGSPIFKTSFNTENAIVNKNLQVGENASFNGNTYIKNVNLDRATIKDNVINFTRSYNVDLSNYENKIYPIVLIKNTLGQNDDFPIINFQVSSLNAGGAVPFNNNTLIGYARGGGWTDKRPLCVTNISRHDSRESQILYINSGSKEFKDGIVIYLRGTIKYTITTDADNVIIPSTTAKSIVVGDDKNIEDKSTFPVKDGVTLANLDEEKNTILLQNVLTTPDGKFVYNGITTNRINANSLDVNSIITKTGIRGMKKGTIRRLNRADNVGTFTKAMECNDGEYACGIITDTNGIVNQVQCCPFQY